MAGYYNKDPNVNYRKLIDEAVAAGDYAKAAQLEKSRNAKITDLDASGTNKWGATKTTDWAQYLNPDYKPLGAYNDAGLNGAAADVVSQAKEMWNKGYSLGDQSMMDFAHQMAENERAKSGYSGGADGSDYIKLQQSYGSGGFSYDTAPTYADKYQSQIDDLLNQILNREDFSYDVTKDPLYAQYAQQYQTEGQRSMRDTMGQIASRTGGMASSYGTTAAQQAGDYYASQLANKVPELYQLAYGMYLDDKESQVEDLGLLQSMSDTQYGRFRDTMSDWRNDRDFAYGVYRDEIGDKQWKQQFDYGASQDSIANDRYAAEYQYQQALDQAETLAKYGDFSGYKALGYTDTQIAAMQKSYQDQLAAGDASASGGYDLTYSDWWNQGVRSEGEAYDQALQSGYSNAEAENMAEFFKNWMMNQNDLLENTTGVSNYQTLSDSLKSMQGIVPVDSAQSMLDKAYLDGLISDEQYNTLQDYIDGHRWL